MICTFRLYGSDSVCSMICISQQTHNGNFDKEVYNFSFFFIPLKQQIFAFEAEEKIKVDSI